MSKSVSRNLSFYDANLSRTDDCFKAVHQSARDLHNLLRCVYVKEKKKCVTVSIFDSGMRLMVSGNTMQANAYLKSTLFSEFDLRQDGVLSFNIPLLEFMESLNMVGTSGAFVSMRLTGPGSPLELIVKDNNVNLTASIQTYVAETNLDFNFPLSEIHAKAILTTRTLRDVIKSIEGGSCTVTLKIRNDELEIAHSSDTLSSRAVFPKSSVDIEDLRIYDDAPVVAHSYGSTLFKRMQTAVLFGTRVSFTVSYQGMLNTQILVPQSDKNPVHVEFFHTPDSDAPAKI